MELEKIFVICLSKRSNYAASLDISCLLWNPKVCYYSEPNNPVYTLPSCFFKIRFNIILLTSGFPSETLCAFLYSPMHAHTPRISALLLTVISNGQRIKWGHIARTTAFFVSEPSREILLKFCI